MAGSGTRRQKCLRGSIEELPSGALRVSVYAGIDPVSGRRHYLKEIVRAGPTAAAEAEKVMRRLGGQVDEQRHPRTSATLDQMLDRYLETLDVGRTPHRMYPLPGSTSDRSWAGSRPAPSTPTRSTRSTPSSATAPGSPSRRHGLDG